MMFGVRRPLVSFFALFCVGALLIAGLVSREPIAVGQDGAAAGGQKIECLVGKGGTLQIHCPAPPDPYPLKEQPDYDTFAWNTFIALNWPAVVPGSANNNSRGFPDTTSKNKSFVMAESSDLAVWETFKEKREVFNHLDGPGDWNQEPNYGPLRGAPDQDPGAEIQTDPSTRPLGTYVFDTFDETVQVASEARERFLTRPNGRLDPNKPNPVYGRPVAPRVWRGKPTAENAVVYEVKVNYDFYQYVIQNQLYVDNTQAGNPVETAALAGRIRLPYRTSLPTGPRGQVGSGKAHDVVVNYSGKQWLTDALKSLNSNSSTEEQTDLPPPLMGAVHTKAAWIRLNPAEVSSGSYHTAPGIYYVSKTGTDANGKPTTTTEAREGTFGLVGLHIIQRVHSSLTDPIGGTFIFATWEHKDNDTAGFTYANFYDPEIDPHPESERKTKGFYPNINAGEKPYRVIRRPGAVLQNTKDVNNQVHAAIKAINEDSVWLNYRLIGTQFRAINVDDRPVGRRKYKPTQLDPTGIGQPLFLANLVIETNVGLQDFQGLPPKTTPTQRRQGIGVAPNDSVDFARNAKNITSGRVPMNMGGCMGCHGVAQSRGYTFSFVLLGGYTGASTDTQSHFDIPPPPPPTPVNK